MWGSEFHFDDQGEIAFAKQVITHPEKVHYLLALSKGTGMRGPDEPADAWRPVPDQELHVPLDQMIYVGDGVSDMPAFALLNEQGGIALAVFKSERAQDSGAMPRCGPSGASRTSRRPTSRRAPSSWSHLPSRSRASPRELAGANRCVGGCRMAES